MGGKRSERARCRSRDVTEKQTEMTSSSLFHKALRTVQDSSNPVGDLWPAYRSPLLGAPRSLLLFCLFQIHTSRKFMSIDRISCRVSFTSPISPITLPARPAACPSAPIFWRKNIIIFLKLVYAKCIQLLSVTQRLL